MNNAKIGAGVIVCSLLFFAGFASGVKADKWYRDRKFDKEDILSQFVDIIGGTDGVDEVWL